MANELDVSLNVGSQALQLDDTDKLAVSLYGKASAAGDVAWGMSPAGMGGIIFPGSRTPADGLTDGWAATRDIADANKLLPVVQLTTNGLGRADRVYNNVEATLLASAARTATANSADQTNYNGAVLSIFCDVSSITDTPSITLSVDWKDSISGDYEPIWTATTAITATGEYVYLLGMGGSGSAGDYDEAVNIRIPRTWRLTVTHADADSITYSVSGCVMV